MCSTFNNVFCKKNYKGIFILIIFLLPIFDLVAGISNKIKGEIIFSSNFLNDMSSGELRLYENNNFEISEEALLFLHVNYIGKFETKNDSVIILKDLDKESSYFGDIVVRNEKLVIKKNEKEYYNEVTKNKLNK